MDYEFLPRPKPGDPPMRFPPGFRDGVRQRIADYRRQQRRRRRIVILLTAVVLVAIVAGVYLLYAR